MIQRMVAGWLILTAAHVLSASPTQAEKLAPAALPIADEPEAACSCYCSCTSDPTKGSCEGSGYCCLGSKAKWLSPRNCHCYPCLGLFFGEQNQGSFGCAPPDRSVLDFHIAALFAGSAGDA